MLSPHLRKKGPGGFVDGPRFLSSIFPHHHILSHVLWTCRGSTPFLSLLFIMTQLFCSCFLASSGYSWHFLGPQDLPLPALSRRPRWRRRSCYSCMLSILCPPLGSAPLSCPHPPAFPPPEHL